MFSSANSEGRAKRKTTKASLLPVSFSRRTIAGINPTAATGGFFGPDEQHIDRRPDCKDGGNDKYPHWRKAPTLSVNRQ